MEALKRLLGLHDTVRAAVVAVIGVVCLVITTWGYVNLVATDTEVAHAVNQHDHGSDVASADPGVPHPALTSRVSALETVEARNAAQYTATEADIRALYKRMTGIVARDRERVAGLRPAAAAFYEEEFDRAAGKGLPPQQAFREALHQVWDSRPGR